jgi:tetratricopeptide (TPR) repeat protein
MGWRWMVALGVVGLSLQTARAAELQAPQNVNAEPSTPQSAALATRSAIADMEGNPQAALNLANQGIRADPRDPWPYYNKGMALAEMRETDASIAALYAAENHFAANDKWGRSLAKYGRAHAFTVAGRCAEAQRAFEEYATFVDKDDPLAAKMARRYAADCNAPASPAPSAPRPPSSVR